MARQRGFILLFVLGVLLVLGMLALSVAYRQRVGFTLISHVKDNTQLGLVLRGAAEYTAAQLVKASALDALVRIKDPAMKGIPLWKPGEMQQIQINDEWVNVSLFERVSVPNINLFDEKELQRLFKTLGATDAQGLAYAQAFLKAKPKDGFTTLDALKEVPGIPQFYWLGKTAAVTGFSSGEEPAKPDPLAEKPQSGSGQSESLAPTTKAVAAPGLLTMVAVTGPNKKVDLNQTALEVVAALTDLPMEKLAKLAALRAKGYVDREAAIDALGPEVAAFLGTPDSYRAILTVMDRPLWAEAIYKQQGRWKIQSFSEHNDGQPPPEATAPPARNELTMEE